MMTKDKPLVGVHVRVSEKLRHRFHLACLREELKITTVLKTYMENFAKWSEDKEREAKKQASAN